MQNTFEQLTKILESLELISQDNLSLPDIEKDIVLEKMRKIYANIQSGKASKPQPAAAQNQANYEVYQGMEEDVDLFFDTEHESYSAFKDVAQKETSNQQEEQRRKEEEQKRLAEEQRRKEEEQKRLAEEKRRKEEEAKRLAEEQRRKEEEAKRIAEEQRRKEEEQKRLAEERRRQEEEQKRLDEEKRRKEEGAKRLAEEQRRKEEEAKRIAEEQLRKDEEQKKRNAPSDEDDLLQFMPKTPAAKPAASQRSLNDLFTEKDGDHSLGAQFQNAKVHDLTKAISINDKFTYIKELFNNKGEEFSAAITNLNQCRNMEEAFNCLEGLKQKYFWDSTSTTYLSLCDLLRRKFN